MSGIGFVDCFENGEHTLDTQIDTNTNTGVPIESVPDLKLTMHKYLPFRRYVSDQIKKK